jgi:hypothetical protein
MDLVISSQMTTDSASCTKRTTAARLDATGTSLLALLCMIDITKLTSILGLSIFMYGKMEQVEMMIALTAIIPLSPGPTKRANAFLHGPRSRLLRVRFCVSLNNF